MGQRRQAVQDGERVRRGRQGRAARLDQDGGHRLEAGRPDHYGRGRKGHRRPLHLYSVQGRRRSRGATGRQSRRFDRQQSDRGGRAMAWRQAAAALRVRRPSQWPMTSRSRTARAGRTFRPASRKVSTSNT